MNPVTYAGLCLSPSARVCDNPRPSVGPDVGLGMARLRERGVQTAKPGRHSDGDGLHLVVSEMGRKKRVLRYQVAGVQKDKGLGAYPSVGLKDARDRATAARRLVARGVDPIEADRAARRPPSLSPPSGRSPSSSSRMRRVSPSMRRSATSGSAISVRPILARCLIAPSMRSPRSTSPQCCAPCGDRSPKSPASFIRRSGASSTAPASSCATSTPY